MNEAPSVDQLAALINFSVDAVFLVDIDGVVHWANPATTTILGYAPDGAIGLRARDLVEPQDLEAWTELVRRIIDHPDVPQSSVFRCRHRDGSIRWAECCVRNLLGEPTVGAIVVNYRDVTDRKAPEEALKAAEAKYRGLVEQSLVGVYVLQNDRLVYVNPKGAAITGYTQREMLDLPWAFALLHEQDRPVVIDQLSRLHPSERANVQLTLRGVRKDGTIVQVEAFCSVTESGGQPAILATAIDISDRVKLEEQLRQAQKMEAVGRLAGGIAHDFNNLLTAIRGNAELMSHRVKHDPAMSSEVNEILLAADRAASLTRQLLAFSRKQIMQSVPLDINDIVSSVTRMARRLIGTGVRLQLELAPTLSLVLADPAQIEQVLLNLIVNARDAMPAGGMIKVQTVKRAPRGRFPRDIARRSGAGRLRAAVGHRRWHWHGPGHAGSYFRTVLYHQGNRPRYRPGLVDRLRNHPANRRRHFGGQRTRARRLLSRVFASRSGRAS